MATKVWLHKEIIFTSKNYSSTNPHPAKHDKSIMPHIKEIKALRWPLSPKVAFERITLHDETIWTNCAERTTALLFAAWSTTLADGANGELLLSAALQTRAGCWIKLETYKCHLLKWLQVWPKRAHNSLTSKKNHIPSLPLQPQK